MTYLHNAKILNYSIWVWIQDVCHGYLRVLFISLIYTCGQLTEKYVRLHISSRTIQGICPVKIIVTECCVSLHVNQDSMRYF